MGTPSSPSVAAVPPPVRVLLVVHGIGLQQPGETVRTVARRLSQDQRPPLPIQPLGYFHALNPAKVAALPLVPDGAQDPAVSPALARLYLSEVHWADITHRAVKVDTTVEETGSWGRTVVSRAERAFRKANPEAKSAGAFRQAAGVVEELVEGIGVLENLCRIASKAGVFTFDLGGLVQDYVSGVQVVADFSDYRNEIIARFHVRMEAIEAWYLEKFPDEPGLEITVLAHSEGTVVSFLALLEALSYWRIAPGQEPEQSPRATHWVKHVRTFATLGSPIDKHMLLWPDLWRKELNPVRQIPRRINWQNYFDEGDPVGFDVAFARVWLARKGCKAFDCGGDGDPALTHDHGFSRYFFPGKAHVDYWEDSDLFGPFLSEIVLKGGGTDKPFQGPRNRVSARVLTRSLPYLLAFLPLAAGVFTFTGTCGAAGGAPWTFTLVQKLSLAVYLACLTVVARLPRLGRWSSLGWLVGLPGLAAGSYFVGLELPLGAHLPARSLEGLGFGLLVAGISWFLPARKGWGRRGLLGLGSAAFIPVLWIPAAASSLTGRPVADAWKMVLAFLAFFYLWWLGVILFDLTFLWHRYVYGSAYLRSLRAWATREPPPGD